MQSELSQSRLHPYSLVVVTLVVVFLGLQFVGPFIGAFIAAAFYPEPMMTMLEHMSSPTNYPALQTPLMIMQGVGEIVGLLLFPLFVLKRKDMIMKELNTQRVLGAAVILLAMILFSFLVIDSRIVLWNEQLKLPEWLSSFEQWARRWEDNLKEVTQYVTTFNSVGSFILGLIVIAILPAIGEELVFRGVIQRDLQRGSGNPHIAIWVTAILFSAFHIQFFGFVPRMLLGALFGYLYYWSGSLVMPMIGHFLNNGLIVVSLYLYHQGHIDVDMENPEAAPWLAVMVACVAFAGLLFFYKRFYEQRPFTTDTEQQNLPHSFD